MANIKSQKKRNRTNELARERNVAVRSRVKTFVGRAEAALDGDDKSQIEGAVKAAIVELDLAARKGVYHSNSIARKKSSLQRRANAAQGS